MAIRPPPLADVVQQISNLIGESGLKTEIDQNLKTLVQSALSRMDVVSREEFDAQTEILARTRSRVEALEATLEALNNQLAAAQK